jgi:DNA-binding beta-propeller fold protein YncE/thiol-disulfide isomerase/thioredoxin
MSRRRTHSILAAVLAVGLLTAACTPTSGDTTTTTEPSESFAGTIDAPDFPEGLDWINTAEPIALNDLKGKVVLLDFWTYGCINCIHVIPDLQRLETEFADELVVIGVHSAKFTNEGQTENLVDIVQRYDVNHPVVNDEDFAIWRTWGVNAWPTTALIDPAGKAVGIRPGEGVYDALQPVIAALIAEFDQADAINREPFEYALEATTAPARPLKYPGKVLAKEGRLWVSDTGHNRILEVDPESGAVLDAWGSGEKGFDDGPALEATFNAPQGLTLNTDANVLYVADVGNHSVRTIDLASGEVTTLVGDGELGWPPTGGALGETRLNSPWDVLYNDDFVYIANAGSHQIWAIDLARERVAPLIGSALEGTANGPFAEAQLAQPSGLALSEIGELFFADSESSSIRVGLLLTAVTDLVVGGDASLFEFGDEDGMGNAARLQHPLGLALDDTTLYVADTYNSKIKRIDIQDGGVTSWLGDTAGWQDGLDPLFSEPGGLSFDRGLLYVADTNNHAIRIIDPTTGETTTLVLKGVEKFSPPAVFAGEITMLEPVSVSAGGASLVLDYSLPAGYKVNQDAPSSVSISGGDSVARLAAGSTGDITGTDLPVTIPIDLTEGQDTVFIDVTLVYCREDAQSLCFIDRLRYEIPLTVTSSGSDDQIRLTRTISS